MKNSEMTAEAKEAKKEYQRAWRRAHPDKVAEYQNRYWCKVAEKSKQQETKSV